MKRGITSGGSCKSAHMITAASPVASRSPAVTAPSAPKLRERRRILKRGSAARIASSFSYVSSAEPFSTMIASKS